MNKDKIIVEYLSQFSSLDEDSDYSEHNNGRTRVFIDLDTQEMILLTDYKTTTLTLILKSYKTISDKQPLWNSITERERRYEQDTNRKPHQGSRARR